LQDFGANNIGNPKQSRAYLQPGTAGRIRIDAKTNLSGGLRKLNDPAVCNKTPVFAYCEYRGRPERSNEFADSGTFGAADVEDLTHSGIIRGTYGPDGDRLAVCRFPADRRFEYSAERVSGETDRK
jgi:hypothetical protein